MDREMCIRDSPHTDDVAHIQRHLSQNLVEGIRQEFFEDNMASVSYTHLDVYKRQLYIHPGILAGHHQGLLDDFI